MKKDQSMITYVCPKCTKESYPFGKKIVELPYQSAVTCPFCKHQEVASWLDKETQKLVIQKQYLNENGEERKILHYICTKCKTINYPYDQVAQTVPRHEMTICKQCGNEEEMNWLDTKLNEQLVKKKLGINDNPDIDTESLQSEFSSLKNLVNSLNEQINSIKQERESTKNQNEILKKEIELLKSKIIALEALHKVVDQSVEKVKSEQEKMRDSTSQQESDVTDILDRLNKVENEIGFQNQNK